MGTQTYSSTDAISSPRYVNGTPAWVQSIIDEASSKYNVSPMILSALLKQESGFNPNAVSPVGAQGIAQFMPSTAQGRGVNPLDPTSAINGAAAYLREGLDKYGGDVKKALAAYNAGFGNVDKFGGVPPFQETQNYVKNILAMAGQPHQSANGPMLDLVNNTQNTSGSSAKLKIGGLNYTSSTTPQNAQRLASTIPQPPSYTYQPINLAAPTSAPSESPTTSDSNFLSPVINSSVDPSQARALNTGQTPNPLSYG